MVAPTAGIYERISSWLLERSHVPPTHHSDPTQQQAVSADSYLPYFGLPKQIDLLTQFLTCQHLHYTQLHGIRAIYIWLK